MATKNKRALGFSLVELLIVIGIVATIGAFIGSSMGRLQKQAHLDDVVSQIAADINKVSSDSKRFGKEISIEFNSGNNRYVFSELGKTDIVHELNHGVYIKEIKHLNHTVSTTTVKYIPPVGEFQDTDTEVTFGITGNDNLNTTLRIIGVTGRIFVQ